MGEAKDFILGSKAPDPQDIKLQGEGEEGDEDAKKRLAETEEQTAATEQALGGVVGQGAALVQQGIDLGEIGRVSAAEQLAVQQQQQEQLLQSALGLGGGAGEEAARQGIEAQQNALTGTAAAAGLQGRGGIAAQRQAGRAGEQLQAQGQGVVQQAQLQDQLQAQQLLGQTIGAGQQQAGQLGGIGVEGALQGVGLQGQALTGLLGGQLEQQAGFQGELLGRLGLDTESQLQQQELLAAKKPNEGFIGGLFNAVGGALGSLKG